MQTMMILFYTILQQAASRVMLLDLSLTSQLFHVALWRDNAHCNCYNTSV